MNASFETGNAVPLTKEGPDIERWLDGVVAAMAESRIENSSEVNNQ